MNCRRAILHGAIVALSLLPFSLPVSGHDAQAHSAQDGASAMPRIELRAAPGYRLYRSGYRTSGNGVLVTAQLCRLPGWAGQGPTHLEILRLDRGGSVLESHDSYVPRLGLRSGNNCVATAGKLDRAPDYGETIRVCALPGRAKCR